MSVLGDKRKQSLAGKVSGQSDAVPVVDGVTSAVNKTFSGEKASNMMISPWLICPRFRNPFIHNDGQVQALMESLEKSGQAQPIRVLDIDKFLAAGEVNDTDRKYLERYRDEYGCKYFASVGNTRLKVFMHQLTGLPFETKSQVEKMYAKVKSSPDIKHTASKYSKIDCMVVDLTPKQEAEISGDSNLTARNIGTFERVYNAYKALGSTEPSPDAINDYIVSNYHMNLEMQHVRNNVRIIKTYKDERFIDAIFDGRLSPTSAITLIPAYLKMAQAKEEGKTAEELDRLLDMIYSADITVAYAKQIVASTKNSKKKKKTSAAKPGKVSRADVISWLYEIKLGSRNVDEAIEYFSK